MFSTLKLREVDDSQLWKRGYLDTWNPRAFSYNFEPRPYDRGKDDTWKTRCFYTIKMYAYIQLNNKAFLYTFISKNTTHANIFFEISTEFSVEYL